MEFHDSQTASPSLLLRVHRQDPAAWETMTQIYGPVVYGWARQAGLQAADAADLVQDVFATVVSNIEDRRGARFRPWLWSIFQSRLMDHFRRLPHQPVGTGGTTANLRLQQFPDAAPANDPAADRREIREARYRAYGLLRDRFESRLWDAFWRNVVEGDKPADIAADLDVSVWFVYKAKSRVLQRLRLELEGLDLFPEEMAECEGA